MSPLENSLKNLLPISFVKNNFEQALREWRYTGNYFDNQTTSSCCELCEKQGLRYHFEISNVLTWNNLLVGSECIKKFEIPGIDNEGNLLNPAETKSKVQADKNLLRKEGQNNRLVLTLLNLAKEDTDFDIDEFISYQQDRGAFTPNQMNLLIWRFNKFGIQFFSTDFKVIIRRDREKKQLLGMVNWKVKKIWPFLTQSQKDWYQSHKYD